MNTFYKIAVVGPIPADTIITHRGELIQKYGCVTHPTMALGKLLNGIGEVIPISHVNKKDHEAINAIFKDLKNVNLSGISSEKDSGAIIELKFKDQNNRLETQLANMAAIAPKDVSNYLDADCFVFVPITDHEIELATLKYIKENSKAKIIFDAHGPTTYVNSEGKRLRRFWDDKDDWFQYIDVLKMNLEESICCWFDQDFSNEDFYDENNTGHLDEFAEYVLSKGVETLYVTLDAKGCVIYTKDEDVITKDFVPSVYVDHVVDTTGCGDSFAGGLAFGLTLYDDVISAAYYANTLGALRTQGKGFGVFKSLEATDQIIEKNY
ncbi:carbohydrate kinase family protein [Geojedonia litorea]|uniref:Carbohydrate kinase family protein n=1 Tax=Geojedonia litorea TaxID=1268269 RepID=A0ABV9N052_9FLAO